MAVAIDVHLAEDLAKFRSRLDTIMIMIMMTNVHCFVHWLYKDNDT